MTVPILLTCRGALVLSLIAFVYVRVTSINILRIKLTIAGGVFGYDINKAELIIIIMIKLF